MNFRTLVARGLRFHWRSHMGVALGAAVATAVLVGALAVGDSVRYSLRAMAVARLGGTETAMTTPDRFFRDQLADALAASRSETQIRPGGPLAAPTAPVVLLRGTAAREDGAARVNQAQVVGVDGRFWMLGGTQNALLFESRLNGGTQPMLADDAQAQAAVNDRTARQLGLRIGDTILVRVEKPSALPLDAPLSTTEDSILAMRVTVGRIVGDDEFGRFGLQANQAAPYNIFLPLAWLQKQLDLAGRANVLLAGGGATAETANAALAGAWQLADAELDLRPLAGGTGLELHSPRVFLDVPVAEAAAHAVPDAVGILTYFVNELRVKGRATPYSMVSAVGVLAKKGPDPLFGFLPADMADDEIVINQWLADDLAARPGFARAEPGYAEAQPGDILTMTYYVVGSSRRLQTRTAQFRIRAVVGVRPADRTLMPDFPGLADVENCRDWHPGVAIDLKQIRPEDEQYWKEHRGTPKGFITLAAGQRMWGNRFGNLTAVRFPPGVSLESLGAKLRSHIDPKSLGLYFQDVRGQALAASSQATDFGGLFLGLSFFLVVAALLLMGLLFVFGVEQRTEESGTLLALGLPVRRVRGLYLAEGGATAAIGGLVGAAAGLLYTRLMLLALATVWRGAVGTSDLRFYAAPMTVLLGTAGGIAVALLAIWLAVRRQARAPARELLASGPEAELSTTGAPRARAWIGLATVTVSAVGATIMLPLAKGGTGGTLAGIFFGVGALVLLAGMGFSQSLLAVLAQSSSRGRARLVGLAVRNAARRRGRSLATIAMLACGIFMVIAVAANRLGPPRDAEQAASGTGGFALYGETSLPVFQDLDSADGRKAFALPAEFQKFMRTVPLRIHEGDDASCLNLNRAQRPRLAGVRPQLLAARGSFTFSDAAPHPADENPWLLLETPTDDGSVPAVADENTITWALGRKVGDTIPYTDDRGRTFQIRLVGAISGSILQGCLVISEDDFIARFPSESGYRMFLIDVPPTKVEEVAKVLSERLSDVGLAVTTAVDRLAAFSEVENTYLAIFQALGGLGLVLGSIGLAVVVLRNVLERRSELALLRAVGFPVRSLYWMVLAEHWLLLGLGVACGVVAAAVAVLPALHSAADVPLVGLGIIIAAVLAGGMLWTILAARLAVRGPLLEALRNE
jgi:ABC-type antimicrobial peptide transport system permease subunit